MDLRWQIQHSEKNWNREKVELLDRLDRDRREWERQKKELLRRIEQVRSRPWVGNGWLQSMRCCTITTLRARSRNCSKKQHRNNFVCLATSVFPMVQNNLHTQGSKRKMLIIPIKDRLWEIGSRLKAISCPISIILYRHGPTDSFCLKAYVHLFMLKHSVPLAGLFKVGYTASCQKKSVHLWICHQRCSCCDYSVSTEFFFSSKGNREITMKSPDW